MKTCPKCRKSEPEISFGKNKNKKDGIDSRCKECRRLDTAAWRKANPQAAKVAFAKWQGENRAWRTAYHAERYGLATGYTKARYRKDPERGRAAASKWARENPEKKRNIAMRSKYGLERADYDRMVAEQSSLCLICRQPDRLGIDHCHATLKVRGLLCQSCNLGLGAFKDNPDLMRRAAEYVER